MNFSLLGSTGLVGQATLKQLLSLKNCTEVLCLNRRRLNIESSKFTEIIQRDFNFEALPEAFYQSSILICCLGSTIKKSKTHVAFKKVDHDYPLAIAKLFKKKGGQHFILLSAMGAHSESKIFYNKTKGQIEEALLALKLPKLSIVRPSLLLGARAENRPMEWLMQKTMPLLVNPLLQGSWARYKAVSAEQVAELLVNLALNRLIQSPIEHLTKENK